MSRPLHYLLAGVLGALPGAAIPQTVGTPGYVTTSSDFPIIYTVGDAQPMVSALNAIAMLFGGSDTTANSFMGSGIASMVLGSLVIMLASSVSRSQMDFGKWALSVLLTFALFYPKTTVKVTSYFDASGGAGGASQLYFVDNVPIGLAIPAGVFGMIGQRLSAGFDTTFTSASAGGGFLALGTDGFAKPLRILLGARDAFSCRENSNFCNNLISFGKYCLHPTSGVKADTALLSQVDGITRFFNSQTTGTMIWWDANGDGGFAPCPAAGAALDNAMTRYVTNVTTLPTGPYVIEINSSFSSDLASRMGMLDSKKESPGSASGLGVDSSYNVMSTWTQQLGATITADNNAIMMNLVFPPHVKAMIESSSSENAEATYQTILRSGMEKARVDMAGEGTMFVNLSISAMNMFTFLFVAFTPIIALVIAVMGASGIKLVASYLVFGLWTQTWMPTAAIISYYAQTSFFSKVSTLRHNGVLSPEHIDRFYQDLASTMATSGTFMAATPMITLSLLTGSIYGLVSLANKAGGNGAAYLNENTSAPDINKAANVDAISKQAESIGKSFSGGGSIGSTAAGPASGPTSFEAQGAGMVTVGSGSSASVGTGTELSSRLASEMKKAESAKAGYKKEYGEEYKASNEGSTGRDGSHADTVSTGGDKTRSSKKSIGDRSSFTQGTLNTTSAMASAGLGIGSGRGSQPGASPGSGDLVEGQQGALAPGGKRLSQESTNRKPGRAGLAGVLPFPEANAGLTANTARQQNDKDERSLSSQSETGTTENLKTGHEARDQLGSSARTSSTGSMSKSAKRAADEQYIRSLDKSVAEAAAAVQSAAMRNESSENTGSTTTVSLGALQSKAVQQGIAGAGRHAGMAGGAAMQAAEGAVGKVAGTDERQAELQSMLAAKKQSYMDGGAGDDRATLGALRDMTLSDSADARAVGFAGIAQYATTVNDPSAKPLSDRADRATDNALALSNAQQALSSVEAAKFDQVAAAAGGATEQITAAAASLGVSPENPAGNNIPPAGAVDQGIGGVQAAAGAQIGDAKAQLGTFIEAGRNGEKVVKGAQDVYQRLDNEKNAEKILDLEKEAEFDRAMKDVKNTTGVDVSKLF